MSKCLLLNKYIYLCIYICLLHFVVNEEQFFLRYNYGNLEWEITLDNNTIGGKALYERLKDKKKNRISF